MTIASSQRLTRQKLAINQALLLDDTFRSAQEIHQALTQQGDKIGLATVYRNLQALAEDGLVDVVRSPEGETMYRSCVRESHHHHLVCRRCGKTTEFEVEGLEAELKQLATNNGFTEITHSVDVFGFCPDCSAKNQ